MYMYKYIHVHGINHDVFQKIIHSLKGDTPKLRADNVSFALTVILNILCPPARNPQQQQNSSSKSTIHHLSFSENHRCSSFSQSDKIHRPENQLLLNVAYLGSLFPCLYLVESKAVTVVLFWCCFILQLLLSVKLLIWSSLSRAFKLELNCAVNLYRSFCCWMLLYLDRQKLVPLLESKAGVLFILLVVSKYTVYAYPCTCTFLSTYVSTYV